MCRYINCRLYEGTVVIEKTIKLDENLEKEIKDCKEKAELLEKFLTMLVKGFISEY